jgi:hypothetical protein
MAAGADQINVAVSRGNEISGQNKENIDVLVKELRLFQNFSFGTATLDVKEKAGICPLFSRAWFKTNGVLEQAQVSKFKVE